MAWLWWFPILGAKDLKNKKRSKPKNHVSLPYIVSYEKFLFKIKPMGTWRPFHPRKNNSFHDWVSDFVTRYFFLQSCQGLFYSSSENERKKKKRRETRKNFNLVLSKHWNWSIVNQVKLTSVQEFTVFFSLTFFFIFPHITPEKTQLCVLQNF